MSDGSEQPYIPGSSLKGVLRSTVERILATNGLYCCDIIGQQDCSTRLSSKLSGISRVRKLVGEVESFQDLVNKVFKIKDMDYRSKIQLLKEVVDKTFCEACKIFGNAGYASRVYVYDATPAKSSDGKYAVWTGIRPGVALDRENGTVARGPFFIEYIEPGSIFNFKLIADSLEKYQIGLILECINLINSGLVLIGGVKSRGMGKVRIELEAPKEREPYLEEWGSYLAKSKKP